MQFLYIVRESGSSKNDIKGILLVIWGRQRNTELSITGSGLAEHFADFGYLSCLLKEHLNARRTLCPGFPSVTQENVNIDVLSNRMKSPLNKPGMEVSFVPLAWTAGWYSCGSAPGVL